MAIICSSRARRSRVSRPARSRRGRGSHRAWLVVAVVVDPVDLRAGYDLPPHGRDSGSALACTGRCTQLLSWSGTRSRPAQTDRAVRRGCRGRCCRRRSASRWANHVGHWDASVSARTDWPRSSRPPEHQRGHGDEWQPPQRVVPLARERIGHVAHDFGKRLRVTRQVALANERRGELVDVERAAARVGQPLYSAGESALAPAP